MAVNLAPPRAEDLLPISGVRLGIAEAGIRKKDRKDLLVVEIADRSRVAGLFTRNRYCAAPVLVCRDHLANEGRVRAIVVNTGIANAGTGAAGLANARATCVAVAKALGVESRAVLPFSTGVIMEHLPTLYVKQPAIPDQIAGKFKGLYELLLNKYRVDEFYNAIFVDGLVHKLAKFLHTMGDVKIIDGFINGTARSIGRVSEQGRKLQADFVQEYAFTMGLGLVVLMGLYSVLK